MAFNLQTCNYSRFRPEMGVPVQSSNGAPRFPLRYLLSHKAPQTYPPRRIMKVADMAEFERLYREHLDSVGVDALAATFEGIARAAGDPRVTLLCFEALDKGKVCHRRMFARWWKDRTGDDVREMGPTGPQDAPYAQGTLL